MAYTFLHHGGACMYLETQQKRHTIKLEEFPIILAINYCTFTCTCDFYRYEHVYTYRKKEFQNILESKIIL